MINFFRKTRKKLADDNKPVKYLRYAIGEILLVVVGILIALSINNWNNRGLENIQEQDYYCLLLQEVNQDLNQIDELLIADKERLTVSNHFIRLLQQKSTIKREVGEKHMLIIKNNTNIFRPNSAVFEDIKSSGSLNILKNIHFKKALNQYFKKVNQFGDLIQINNSIMLNTYLTYSDLFESGWVHGRMEMNRFKVGLEKDIYDNIKVDDMEVLTSDIQQRMYNDGLRYASISYRRLDLNNQIKKEIELLLEILMPLCIKDTPQ